MYACLPVVVGSIPIFHRLYHYAQDSVFALITALVQARKVKEEKEMVLVPVLHGLKIETHSNLEGGRRK